MILILIHMIFMVCVNKGFAPISSIDTKVSHSIKVGDNALERIWNILILISQFKDDESCTGPS